MSPHEDHSDLSGVTVDGFYEYDAATEHVVDGRSQQDRSLIIKTSALVPRSIIEAGWTIIDYEKGTRSHYYLIGR